MRSTVDLPDTPFRRTKATVTAPILQAIEKAVTGQEHQPEVRVRFPLVKLPRGNKVDLAAFDLDDLPA